MLNFTPYAAGHDHPHGLDTTTGFVVRRTFFDDTKMHEDVETFLYADNPSAYLLALECVREARAGRRDGYAVIDTLYACGCRGGGVAMDTAIRLGAQA